MEFQSLTSQINLRMATLLEGEGQAGAENLLVNFQLFELIVKGQLSLVNGEIRINLAAMPECKPQTARVNVEIVSEVAGIVKVITLRGSVILKGQAGKFFIACYQNIGKEVPHQDLAKLLFNADDLSAGTKNKLYQVKKLVDDKIANLGFTFTQARGRACNSTYCLWLPKF